ncbi:MAG: glycine cleavage system protein GcvH [Desulfobacterales bacterium]
MKELSELFFSDDVKYSKNHEWARLEGGTVTVGISDYAQDQLGDIVFVEVPQVGERFEQGAEFGTLESVKAVSEIYMPVGGQITAVNKELEDEPELVNQEPFKAGWIVKLKPDDPAQMDQLMDKNAYIEMLKGK